MLHDQKDIMILQDNVIQSDDIFVASVEKLAQVAESCNLTAEQVSGDLIVDSL